MDNSVYCHTEQPHLMDHFDPQCPSPQKPRVVSSVPSCVSMKSDCSIVSPPVFSNDPPQSDPKPRAVSPVPSSVSMKSDSSMVSPPGFSNDPPHSDPKPRAVSPVPSCVSMKSDCSMVSPPVFSNDPPQSDSKPRAVSPVPSCVSMKSDCSMVSPPVFSNVPPQSDPKPRAVSPVPSSVSMKSDSSMVSPPGFSNDPPHSDPKPRAVSPVPSCVSMKSDCSMVSPPVFSNDPPQSDSKPRAVSPVPSCVSMKSDCSMVSPPVFSNVPPQSDPKPRAVSPVPSCVSMKSDCSMVSPPVFSNVPPQSDPNIHSGLSGDCSSPQSRKRCKIQPDTTMAPTPSIKRATLSDNHKLNEVLMSHKASMKRRFENICEGIERPGAQTLLNDIYTELYITEGDSEGMNNEHEVWQVEAAFRTQTTEDTAINCNDIFKPLPRQKVQTRTVMTKGIAGIGKTVSVQKFILDWAEEKANHDIDFMFVLPFRELNLVKHDPYSLHRLLLDFHPELRQLENAEYRDCNVVFIFDGLDESQLPLSFQEKQKLFDVTQTASVDVLMTSLIQGTLLPSSLIWITSRPAAASQIPSQCVDLMTEVRGFNDTQKEEYFIKRITDQTKANRIISHMTTTRGLHIMCHMPVFCWIAAIVLQQILEQNDWKEVPKTLTEMFIYFLRIQTTRKDQKYQRDGETDGHLKSHKDVILKLAELAFTHLENGNLMFYEEDLKQCGIDVSEASVYSGLCTEIFKEECVFNHKKVYCFVHLSIQEFLAALHVFSSYLNKNMIALGPFVKTKAKVTADADMALDELLKIAVNKALESKNGHLDLFVRFLHGISLDSNQIHLLGLLPHIHSSPESVQKVIKNLKEIQRPNISPERYINLFHCLVEMHDSSIHDDIQAFLKKGKGSVTKLSLAQCSALAHVLLISDDVLDEFDLKKYNTSPEGRRRLIPAVRCCRKAILADCGLTETSCESVASALQSVNSPVRELDLGHNDLQKSGEKLLSALQNSHCKLEMLRLTDCKLTEKSCENVTSVLHSANSTLRELDLSDNDLQKTGEKLLSALQSPNCKLKTLRLVGCGLNKEGGCILAFALQSANSHLKDLDLSMNSLECCVDELCSEALNPHCKLETLRLGDCKLPKKHCEVVVQYVKSLTEVDLTNNHMSVTALQLLNAGMSHPSCKLRILRLAGCKMTGESSEIVASAVQSCASLTDLDLGDNHMTVHGVQLLHAALRAPNCMLQTLRLVGCGLTEEAGCILAFALQSVNSHLRDLDLSKNILGSCGEEFSEALNPHCKLETLRLAGCELAERPCEVIVSAVQFCVSLTELDLSEYYMSSSGIQLLNAALRHHKVQILRYHHGGNSRIQPELRMYACELTLDPNTADTHLSLSEGNRKVTHVRELQSYPDHPDRFDYWLYPQVLCREGLSGRCYWEAEWSGDLPEIAVAYKSIQRKGFGDEIRFGQNEKSWSLSCHGGSYTAYHNKKTTVIAAPSSASSRVGVYLDWPAGTLSYYSVSSDTLTHLHTFHSTFTEPLYPGFLSIYSDSALSLCQIRLAPQPTGTSIMSSLASRSLRPQESTGGNRLT